MDLPMSWLRDYTDITGVTQKEYSDNWQKLYASEYHQGLRFRGI